MQQFIHRKLICFVSVIFSLLIFAQSAFCASRTMVYDELNRLTETKYDDGSVIKYEYDEIGVMKNRQVTAPTLLPVIPDGDLNLNGSVDIADALLALRIAVGLIPVSKLYLAHGDVAPFINSKPVPDGIINIADALVILRKVVGIINWSTTSGSAQQSLAAAAPMTATTALAAASVNSSSIAIIPTGNGAYTIQGNNMDGIAGIRMTIAYVTTTLASPSVTLGSLASGAIMLANTTTNPGSITIGIMSTNGFSGSGPLAVVKFATWNSTSVVPTFQKYDLSDINGNKVSSFDVNRPVIIVSTSGCGTVSPAGPVSLGKGGSQTFTFQASVGSYLADVKVNGLSVGIVPSYTFTNVTNNHTVQASFIIPDGDINNNGVVDIADVLLAQRIAVVLDPLTPLARAHGDVAPLVNGVPAPNGTVDISDTLQILRKVNGLVSWNTTCVPSQQQGLSAATLAATSSLSASSSTSVASQTSGVVSPKTTSCRNYYKLYDEQTLMGILTMLDNADSKGKDVVTNNRHSIVARKITSCDIDLEFYNDVKQKNLLCTERVKTCVSAK